jgi:hypothetical protein
VLYFFSSKLIGIFNLNNSNSVYIREMKNMGIRLKVLLGFLILTIMLIISGSWSIYEMNRISSSVQDILDENYQSIYASKMMIEALERQDSAILLLLIGQEEKAREIIKSTDSLFQNYYQSAVNNITIKGEEICLDTISAKYKIIKKLTAEMIGGNYTTKNNLNLYFNNIHGQFLSAKGEIEKLINLNDKSMYKTATDLRTRSKKAIMPGIIAIISALIFTLLFNYFLNYYIVNPIIKITRGIREYKMNKKPFDVSVETRDEIYDLVNSITDLCEYVPEKDKNL